MNIGENIRKERKNKKLTLKELGSKVGLSEQAIGQYERGDRTPSTEILIRIANALDVALIDLIGAVKSIGLEETTREEKEILNYITNNIPTNEMIYSRSELNTRSYLSKFTDKDEIINYKFGEIDSMLKNFETSKTDITEVNNSINELYYLFRKRTPADILKELIKSLNYDYDIKKIDEEISNEILKRVSSVIEIELHNLNK